MRFMAATLAQRPDFPTPVDPSDPVRRYVVAEVVAYLGGQQ